MQYFEVLRVQAAHRFQLAIGHGDQPFMLLGMYSERFLCRCQLFLHFGGGKGRGALRHAAI